MTYLKSQAPEPSLIIGYTTRLHLLLDLDVGTLGTAKYLTAYIMGKWPKVGRCLICQTKRGHHLIFDNRIGYNACTQIVEQIAREGWLEKDYVKIRSFRGDMTLRVSERLETVRYTPPPKPKCMIENQYCQRKDDMIQRYMDVLSIGISLSWNYAVALRDSLVTGQTAR